MFRESRFGFFAGLLGLGLGVYLGLEIDNLLDRFRKLPIRLLGDRDVKCVSRIVGSVANDLTETSIMNSMCA